MEYDGVRWAAEPAIACFDKGTLAKFKQRVLEIRLEMQGKMDSNIAVSNVEILDQGANFQAGHFVALQAARFACRIATGVSIYPLDSTTGNV